MKGKATRKYFKNKELLSQIGINIRQARLANQISQETLAIECDVDISQINRMELGKVNFSISYLYTIAAALKVDPKALLP